MKTTLIIVACLAVVLGIVAYFAVFSGTQFIEPTATNATNQTSTLFGLASTTATSTAMTSSTAILDSSSTSILPGSADENFQSMFSAPYPVTWVEGQTQFAITGASLIGSNLSLVVSIQTGSSTDCIPVDLRFVIDEQGDMEAPSTPASPNFLLSSDGSTCTPNANTVYPNEPTVFTVDPTAAPYLFTTGDASNIYFEVATTTAGGIEVSLPQQSG